MLADDLAVLDLRGLSRLHGEAREIARTIRDRAAGQGLEARVVVAPTAAAAVLVVLARPEIAVVSNALAARVLGSLPVDVLSSLTSWFALDVQTALPVLHRWGVTTLGALANLPPAALAARLGPMSGPLQRLARGEDLGPLVPHVPEERFAERADLEWPVETLPPLGHVLGPLSDAVCARLERRGRAAIALHLELRLSTRESVWRSLQLPAPVRDAAVVHTLLMLHLEAHPPGAGIDAVQLSAEPAPRRVLQRSLLARAVPVPERVATLMARLTALVGDSRCGAPELVDTHRPGAFGMGAFVPASGHDEAAPEPPVRAGEDRPVAVIRRFRAPVAARVEVERGRPVRVRAALGDLGSGWIQRSAGPWRSSGDWWEAVWDCDEWDVSLAGGAVYRLRYERQPDTWTITGAVD